MATRLTIPEWTGTQLTNGSFLNYADSTLAAYVAVGLGDINLTTIGMQLTEALDSLRLAVNRQRAYDEKAAGTTPELRKAVANLLVKAAKRVNSVYDIDPDNAKAEQVIVKVCGIVEHYKLDASEAKHRKGGDEPEPEPEPETV